MRTLDDRFRLILGSLVALAAQSTSVLAQPPEPISIEYKDKTVSVRFAQSQELLWLPDGSAYVEFKTDAAQAGQGLLGVDPDSGLSSPLFDADTRADIVRQYVALAAENAEENATEYAAEYAEGISAADGNRLPFDQFSFGSTAASIRFSVKGAEYLHLLNERKLIALPAGEQDEVLSFMYPKGVLSPDNRRYAFVKGHDIHVFNTDGGSQFRLTANSDESTYFQYINMGTTLAWSPDSSRLAYFRLQVEERTASPIIHHLGEVPEVEISRMPAKFALELHVFDLESSEDVILETATTELPYLRNVQWLSAGNEITYQRLNYFLNQLELIAFNTRTGAKRTLVTEKVDKFLYAHDNFSALKGREEFVWTSERTGFRHVYIVSLNGGQQRQVTRGEWEVADITHIDERNELIYFHGLPFDGADQHLYRVGIDGSDLTDLTSERGFHETTMDPSGRYFVDHFSSQSVPPRVSLHRANSGLLRNLSESDDSEITALGIREPEQITLRTADGTMDMSAMLFKPVDFNSARTYPLLVYVYGGPHSREVLNRYMKAEFLSIMPDYGFVLAVIDARGTPGKGMKFHTGNYLSWGQIDVDDQAAGVRQIAKRPYIDGTRVGVFGISHGGFMTAMMMLRQPKVFHVGVVGAPVIDWDNKAIGGYAVRGMQTTETNPLGYEKAKVLNHVQNLEGKLMLHHGTADRNARLTETMRLADGLIKANKSFDMMIYPDGEHVLQGEQWTHVMKKHVEYFLMHLKPDDWQDSLQGLWQ